MVNQDKQCGKCNLCCKLMIIPELEKPDNVWCTHCDIGTGCRIYDARPQMCRDFRCHYLTDDVLGEEWNPARSHFVLRSDGNMLIVQVDPHRPDAWKRPPYYVALHKHAANIYRKGGQIVARIGDQAVAILPDRDVDLGLCSEEDRVVTTPQFTPQGVRWTAQKLSPGGPVRVA